MQGAAALAIAQQVADRKPFLKIAEHQARRLEKERASWSMAHTHLIRAAIAALRGHDIRAVALLDRAIDAYADNDMFSYAAAARRRRGELVGGDEGRALVRDSNTWMAGRGIQNPTRMTAMYTPGFPDQD